MPFNFKEYLEISMLKRNQIIKSFFVSGLLVAGSASYAQDPINTDATVVVQNTFAFAQDAALSFGTLRANADSNASDSGGDGSATPGITVATYTVRPDSAVTSPVVRQLTANGGAVTGDELTPASISVLAAGTAASYTASGASPFTPIQILASGTSDSITLINGLAPPSAPNFTVDQFLFEEVGTAGVGNVEGATFTTDVNGAVSFNVGATISTPTTATSVAYADGTYTGTFTVEVSY